MKSLKHLFLLCFMLIMQTSFSLVKKSDSLIINIAPSILNLAEDNDAVILSEINEIDITGLKAEFITFSITKKVKFKVLNAAGVKKYSKFTLPEEFDPTSILHFPEERNYTYVFSKLKCNYFKGTITSAKGETKNAEISETIDPVKMVMVENNYYGNFEKYVYQIKNIEAGDEISIEYNYIISYAENFGSLSSFRIFFNKELPVENYQLTLTHESKLNIDIFFGNSATPDSTVKLGDKKMYYWKKTNLSGCLKEQGSIPFLSLPYVLFSIKPLELLYTLPYSFEEKYIPFYVFLSYNREKKHLGIAKSIAQNVKTKQMLQIDDFIEEQTKDIISDSTGYQKLLKVQNTIAGKFKFKNDTNYFKKTDTWDPKIGDDVKAELIRDVSRYDMYVALIMKLGLVYYTAYISDNRTGEINNDYFAPIYNGDYLFAVILNNNTVQYIYPKKSNFGYYLNEYPFYFENSKARLVFLDDYNSYKNPINESLRQIELPGSTAKDNSRKNSIAVLVNTDSLTVSFKAKINLSGQYSTLTRGLYQFNYQDETINKLYNKKIWEINDKVQVTSSEIKVNSMEFPFNATVSAHYKSASLVKKSADTILVNLENWFNHIIYSNIDTINRQLDFYPDFLGKDSYVYYIQFDKPIQLLNTIDNTEIKNDFGELIIKVEQAGADVVKITSFFSITNKMVAAKKIYSVKEIYDKIQILNKSKLKCIILSESN